MLKFEILFLQSSYNYLSSWLLHYQGLIQKENVHIDLEKGVQINILANKTVT